MVRVVRSWIGALIVSSIALGASGSPREESLSILAGIQGARGGVEVWVNEPGVTELGVGEAMTLHFRSDRDGYLTVLYLDGAGAATVLLPTADPEAGAVRRGEVRTLGSAELGASLEAQAPLGSDTIFSVATPEPVSLSDLGLSATSQPFQTVEPGQVSELARRLAKAVERNGGAPALAGRFDLRVVERLASVQTPYTARGIVKMFTEQTRSLERRPLNLEIHFDFASAELTNKARRNLDEVGAALRDPALEQQRFALGGHTDDVGNDSANLSLSERRAEAAKRYLVQQYGIDPKRLAADGFGEARPVVPNQTEQARAANRRVELNLAR